MDFRLQSNVYTVNDESQHLIIRGVPSVNLYDEVDKLCKRYGNVLNIRQVQFEDQEEFTHSFHVTFARIQAARFGKKQMDTKNFFGGILHVCYAPELETIEQTRSKLQTRIIEVTKHMNKIVLDVNNEKNFSKGLGQYESTSPSHYPKQIQNNSQQNRWLEGGLKCSYIIPKPNTLNISKEKGQNKLNAVKDSTPLDSKTLRFVPRQLSMGTTSVSKTKKPNRVIFHRQTDNT